ncbi:MAG: hypothetical protein ACXVUL_02735 [Solirubrobacteraceae bacterium]
MTNYLSYVGGKAGAANQSLPPVTIGFVNQQGGQQQIGPLATNGAQIAVKYINTELGGIDGHPLVLKTCFIRSAEEEGTTCGQQFLANKSISVIDEGAVAIGDQSFQSTIGTAKPVIVGVAVTPIDGAKATNVVLFGDATHVLGPFGTYAQERVGDRRRPLGDARTRRARARQRPDQVRLALVIADLLDPYRDSSGLLAAIQGRRAERHRTFERLCLLRPTSARDSA